MMVNVSLLMQVLHLCNVLLRYVLYNYHSIDCSDAIEQRIVCLAVAEHARAWRLGRHRMFDGSSELVG